MRVTVSDIGEGISPELLPHVFERFVRGDGEGTGLGLPICKSIVETCGGSIGVESELGRGGHGYGLPCRSKRKRKRSMSENGTVLLVEDDMGIQRINRRILEREGYTVLCAHNLAGARAMLVSDRPDVLVLDIELPDGNGVAFCKEIRPTTSAPVLFLTGRDEEDSIVEGLEAGGNDYITKPYSVEVLVARVNALLRLARMNRTVSEKAQTMTRGPLTLKLQEHRVLLRDKDIQLTNKEFALLLQLAENEGTTLSAETLYQAVWHTPMAGDNRTLKKHLSVIRKKLEEGESGYTISAVYGKGYVFQVLE